MAKAKAAAKTPRGLKSQAAQAQEESVEARIEKLFEGSPDRRVIAVRGAREHNLKNIDLTIPRDKLVVFTGLSGSGKSSLAFDTIYAEGQRRYVESLSAYARQFLEMMSKARRRSDRRALAGHLHRAEDDVEEPALHCGHGDRDLRLPAPALGLGSASPTRPPPACRSRARP